MKKKFLALVLASFLLTSCTNKWTVDRSDMPAEVKQKNEELLNSSLESLKSDSENPDMLFEVAYRYELLGKYSDAVDYYKQVLNLDENNLAALNNMASIYEEVGEISAAADSIKKLYELNPTGVEAIKDTVRILIKADMPEDATKALENFVRATKDKQSPELLQLVSDLFTSIKSYEDTKKSQN